MSPKRDKWRFHPDESVEGLQTLSIDVSTLAREAGDVTAQRRKQITREWQALLPRLTKVKTLRLEHKVSQDFFEAVCSMPKLERLEIKWNCVRDLSPLAGLPKLSWLALGSSPQVASIEVLARMRGLTSLWLENVPKVRRIDPIAELSRLRSLGFQGSMWTTQVIDSVAPLARLTRLERLCMANLRAKDRNLRPLAALKNLTELRLALWWRRSDFEYLHAALPKLVDSTVLEVHEDPTRARD